MKGFFFLSDSRSQLEAAKKIFNYITNFGTEDRNCFFCEQALFPNFPYSHNIK
jgi:hypothetical protein